MVIRCIVAKITAIIITTTAIVEISISSIAIVVIMIKIIVIIVVVIVVRMIVTMIASVEIAIEQIGWGRGRMSGHQTQQIKGNRGRWISNICGTAWSLLPSGGGL